MKRVLRVQTVKLDGPGFSSISPERRRKVEKNRSFKRASCAQTAEDNEELTE